MIEKLEEIKHRFEEVGLLLVQPEIIQDIKKYMQLNKEYKDLEKVVVKYNQFRDALNHQQQAKEVLEKEKDADLRAMAKEELDELAPKIESFEKELKEMLIPKDPNDDKNIILEIRGGTGGDEAALFAGDLFRMYQRFCDRRGLKLTVLDSSDGTAGGYKEIVSSVVGEGAYALFKFESGVHRVQRVPKTETQGRIHTSAASVVVLPEAEEFDIELNEKDIRKDTFCSSGPGGQSVNTTYSAIRLTHIPTGIVVSCQDEKSQLKNLAKAMKVLRSRIFEIEYSKYLEEVASKRKTMVSTGDRSAKIRTYNWPQGRVTDHRINLTLYNLSAIIDGDLNEVIEKLQMAENAERLKTELEA